MKTLKALKITSILNGIFCFFCIASTICFAINRYFDLRVFFDIANILIYGWIINPVGIISFVVCLMLFLTECKSSEAKQVMEKMVLDIYMAHNYHFTLSCLDHINRSICRRCISYEQHSQTQTDSHCRLRLFHTGSIFHYGLCS